MYRYKGPIHFNHFTLANNDQYFLKILPYSDLMDRVCLCCTLKSVNGLHFKQNIIEHSKGATLHDKFF